MGWNLERRTSNSEIKPCANFYASWGGRLNPIRHPQGQQINQHVKRQKDTHTPSVNCRFSNLIRCALETLTLQIRQQPAPPNCIATAQTSHGIAEAEKKKKKRFRTRRRKKKRKRRRKNNFSTTDDDDEDEDEFFGEH